MMQIGNPSDVSSLVFLLGDLEVELPAEIVDATDQMVRLHALRPEAVLPAKLIGLSDDDMATVIRDYGVGLLLNGERSVGSDAVVGTQAAMGFSIAAELLRLSEGILEQLRPAFDATAALVHHATELGITPRTTDRDVLHVDDVAAARDAWAALPGQVRELGRIASARMMLSEAVGLPPRPQMLSRTTGVNMANIEDVAGAMFCTDARPFREEFEATWQTWVRLCTGTPARLLSPHESVEAMRPPALTAVAPVHLTTAAELAATR